MFEVLLFSFDSVNAIADVVVYIFSVFLSLLFIRLVTHLFTQHSQCRTHTSAQLRRFVCFFWFELYCSRVNQMIAMMLNITTTKNWSEWSTDLWRPVGSPTCVLNSWQRSPLATNSNGFLIVAKDCGDSLSSSIQVILKSEFSFYCLFAIVLPFIGYAQKITISDKERGRISETNGLVSRSERLPFDLVFFCCHLPLDRNWEISTQINFRFLFGIIFMWFCCLNEFI